jgi:hypothetical protein
MLILLAVLGAIAVLSLEAAATTAPAAPTNGAPSRSAP